MTPEEKAQRYNEALKRAKKLYEQGTITESLSYVFPELAESEDERIRKEIIATIHLYYGEPLEDEAKEMISWLEKQGEQPPAEEYNITGIGSKNAQGKLGEMIKRKLEMEKQGEQKFEMKTPEESLGIDSDTYNKIVDECVYGEQKPKFRVGDTIKCKYDDRQFTIKSVDLDKGTYTYTQEGCGNDIDYADEEFELVEQKPIDKVKSKFHEGEWVILTAGELSTTLQIGKVDTDKKLYWFNDDSYLPVVDEECLHRWTIQDAKDGDVLIDDLGVILFRKIGNKKYENAVDYHCVVYISGKFEIQEGLSCWGLSTYAVLRPATKEQRDVLFSKMKEAGYEWDAEKKELRKIKPKFHKGEWVTNGIETVQITGYDIDYGYQVDYKGNLQHRDTDVIEKEYHLWTIQDAKDGDVLATSNYIYIFNSIDKETETVAFYCVMKKSDEYFSFGDYRIHDEILNSVPATKEQCDTLIKAMVKAGCEFDFEKKEFKKIEQKSTDMIESTPHNYITPNKQFFQWIYDRLIYVHNENPNVDYMLSLKERIENMQKPTWSEEDEKMLDTLIADYEFLSKKYRDQEHDFFVEISLAKDDLDMISWFKSLKDRVCCEANCTTTKEWSEEDKAIFDRANVWLNNLCDYLKNCSSDCIPSEIKNIIKKLESFKERCIWKPSDDQMKVLYKYAEQNNYDGTILTSLYNDLKQL